MESLIALMKVPQLGAVRIRQLIDRFGSAEAVCSSLPEAVASLPRVGAKTIEALRLGDLEAMAREEIDLSEQHGITLLPFFDKDYPRALLQFSDAPVLLYLKGRIGSEDGNAIAVIGTRQASIYGRETAIRFSRELAQAGCTVVSGLARGIDTAAHCGALEKGRTIAVIGSGLLHIYPTENIRLADKIAERGAVISEFPLLTPPDRQNFPHRNRIVSGMTRGTLLIEAPLKSGAMHTASKARKQGRPVFVIPSRVDQQGFEGNHSLIKKGEGKLVENSGDVLGHFNDLFALPPSKKTESRSAVAPPLDPEEQEVMEALKEGERNIDQITLSTRFSSSKINIVLMRLLLKEMIREYPGKIYKKAS